MNDKIHSDYSVQIYSFDSAQELKAMNVHVFGNYTYYLFHINSNYRFEGDIQIDEENTLENVIVDLKGGKGVMQNIDENGYTTVIGSFYETNKPEEMGKILLTNEYKDCYAVYKKIPRLINDLKESGMEMSDISFVRNLMQY